MAEQATKEPTMEEILASIRKIISEDGSEDAPAVSASAPEDAPEIDDDFIGLSDDLDEVGASDLSAHEADSHLMSVKDLLQSDSEFDDNDGLDDLIGTETTAVAEPIEEVFAASGFSGAVARIDTDASTTPPDFEALEQIVSEPAPIAPAPAPEPAPVAAAAPAAPPAEPAMSAPQTVAIAPAEAALGLASVAGGNTIEGLVSELVRPMIRQWIDANLQQIVEQRVEAEIQLVADKVIAALRAE